MLFSPKIRSGSGRGRAGLGQAWAKGQAGAGIWLFRSCWGISDTSLLAGAAWVSWQRWLREIREHPGRPRETGGLAGPSGDGALIAAALSAEKGFGKPTCCQISALIIFFKIKGIIFVLGTSTSALSLLPFSLCLSPTRTHVFFFAALGDFLAAQGSEKQIPASFTQEQGKGDALSMG